MQKIAKAVLSSAMLIGLNSAAIAADMTVAEIKSLVIGKTHYLESTAASVSGSVGQSIIYWAEDGTALFKTPPGAMWTGTWQIKDNTLCTEWKQRPGTGCGRWDKTGDAVSIFDAASGKLRAKILKSTAGNAEKLAP